MREPIEVEIGGTDDPFPEFPSSLSAYARRHYEETGEPYRFHSLGNYVIDFIEDNCVLTDSHFAGSPFVLMDWQKRYILETYRAVLVDGEWVRAYRWSLLGVPKKNGKTELAAALGVYHAIDDDEISPRVLCGASSDEQANILFSAATRMCDWSPTIDGFTEPREKSIIFKATMPPGELKRVAAAAGSNDGKNVSATLIDELHEWVAPKSRAVFTVITQGGGARKQPINIMITTAGSDEDSLCYEWYERGCALREGELEDNTFYFCWFEAPEDADYRDPKTWEKANPSWGLILKKEFYEDIITKRSESEFCRYFLNRWMDAEEIWEAAQYWPQFAGHTELRDDRRTYVGIDIGRRHDNAAVVAAQWDEDTEEIHVVTKFWSNPHQKGTVSFNEWALDLVKVEDYLKELYEICPEPSYVDDDGWKEPGPKYLYDPHLFTRSDQILRDEGLNMVEMPQTDSQMVPASQNLFVMIKTGRIVHDGSHTMERHMRSVVAKPKERGWRISKPTSSKKKIDGAVALAMAVYGASMEYQSEEDFNIY